MLDRIYSEEAKREKAKIRLRQDSFSSFSKKIGDTFENSEDINPADLKWIVRKGPHLLIDAYRRTEYPPGGAKDKILPNMLFVVDSSLSMGWEIGRIHDNGIIDYEQVRRTVLNNSSYDFLIRTVYSILEYLDKENLLSSMSIGLLNFSDVTIWSGWKRGDKIEDVKKLLFSYQNGGTTLETEPLRRIYSASRQPIISIFVSDGDITNADDVFVSFFRTWRSQPFIFVKIGNRDSNLSQRIKNAGLPVVNIMNAKDLEDILITFTKSQIQKNREKVTF